VVLAEDLEIRTALKETAFLECVSSYPALVFLFYDKSFLRDAESTLVCDTMSLNHMYSVSTVS
jgi:hypothetical protein